MQRTDSKKSLTYNCLLGVQSNASSEEIKEAYKKAAIIWHPDRAASNSDWLMNEDLEDAVVIFKKIKDAYEILLDPKKPVQSDPELNEQFIAKWEKLTEKYLRKRDPQIYIDSLLKKIAQQASMIEMLQAENNLLKSPQPRQTPTQSTPSYPNIFSTRTTPQNTCSKIPATGLLTIYKVYDTHSYHRKFECMSLMLAFQTREQALQFQKSWDNVQEDQEYKFAFQVDEKATAKNNERHVLLYVTFERSNTLSGWLASPRGEKMLSELEKYAQIESIKQVCCRSNYTILEEHEIPLEKNSSARSYNNRW